MHSSVVFVASRVYSHPKREERNGAHRERAPVVAIVAMSACKTKGGGGHRQQRSLRPTTRENYKYMVRRAINRHRAIPIYKQRRLRPTNHRHVVGYARIPRGVRAARVPNPLDRQRKPAALLCCFDKTKKLLRVLQKAKHGNGIFSGHSTTKNKEKTYPSVTFGRQSLVQENPVRGQSSKIFSGSGGCTYRWRCCSPFRTTHGCCCRRRRPGWYARGARTAFTTHRRRLRGVSD